MIVGRVRLQMHGREAETRAVADLLTTVSTTPSALLMEGQPGIGKTTLWLAGIEQAREQGFQVLSARPAAAESAMAYSSLADLLASLDTAAWSELPHPQRRALDHVLLRADAGEAPTEPRAVAAALLSVVHRLALESPVLLAIDDLQWLDMSSRRAIAFAARRFSGRVGILATTRSDRDNVASWLQLPRPDALHRISLHPLTISGLHAVITDRLGTSFPRPTVRAIHEMSGGNPFYGLELARSLDGHALASTYLPAPLAELVRARVGSVGHDVRRALLAVACVAAPSVELVAGAMDTGTGDLVRLLVEAESSGIIEIDGGYLRFAHPLLARGVYTDAAPAARRAMHEKLAGLVEEPEARARHLALSATSATPTTLESLDIAAELARKRGAPAAAAELLDLALGLGGGTPERQIRCATHHVGAGNPGRARKLLNDAIAHSEPGIFRASACMLLAVVDLFDDSFLDAAALLERGLREVGDNVVLQAQMLVTLTFALLNARRQQSALESAEEAVAVATRSEVPPLLGQALGMRAMLRFMQGNGLDQSDVNRALAMEGTGADIPIAFRPTLQNALLLGWSGQLESARDALSSIRRGCLERGEEGELVFVSFHACLVAIWLGALAEASELADDTVERAQQLGGDVSLFVALTTRAAGRAYAGQETEARSDITEAMAASVRSGSVTMAEWPVTVLGFLEVSLGNYRAALAALEPLIANIASAPEATEIIAASFIPDAVEALIHLNRLDDAEPLIELLERNGRRLDRPWMLAVGGRCRAMLLAARDDIDGAQRAAEQAMIEHGRLPMPFERARTQLLLGHLQRRLRQGRASTASLTAAARVFDQLGTPLWAARARTETELPATDIRRHTLTPSELKVARLTGSGMTNAEVSAALFISPKTVEFHLARVYRKLRIRSRAELGRHMREPNEDL
jgi:DNA-binding CsgD family transcriptional regulator